MGHSYSTPHACTTRVRFYPPCVPEGHGGWHTFLSTSNAACWLTQHPVALVGQLRRQPGPQLGRLALHAAADLVVQLPEHVLVHRRHRPRRFEPELVVGLSELLDELHALLRRRLQAVGCPWAGSTGRALLSEALGGAQTLESKSLRRMRRASYVASHRDIWDACTRVPD